MRYYRHMLIDMWIQTEFESGVLANENNNYERKRKTRFSI